MSDVAYLVTVVDIDDRAVADQDLKTHAVDAPAPRGAQPGRDPVTSDGRLEDPHEMSFSAVHQAVLRDGRRLTLLDDRGWAVHGPPDIWTRTSVEEIEADARAVVGPDEPYDGHSQADMESDHWSCLANELRRHGVYLQAEELSRLSHTVELSERLRARLSDT